MKRGLLLVTATALLLAMQRDARADDPDPWFGHDKVLHFSASAFIAAEAYGVTAAFSDVRAVRLAVGGGVALAAGAGKELYDLSGHGDPSWRDFTWDVIGTIVGLALAYGIDLASAGVNDRHPALGAPAASAAPRGVLIRF